MRVWHAPVLTLLILVLTDITTLPLEARVTQEATQEAAAADWLINDAEFKATVHRSADDRELSLTNGLIRRTFRLAPNLATVAFENLVTRESILRAVRPEAAVTIDGVIFPVGGLIGQPNHAFLLPEWLEQMQADERAMKFTGYEVGPIQPRMEWKRVRHHAPDAEWPPKGVSVRFDFALPDNAALAFIQHPLDSHDGRDTLLTDEFKTLDPAWRIHASKNHERSSFQNEGKVGEIYTPANTAVFAERDLPQGTRIVEVTIHPGTDQSKSWGPGVALVFSDRTIKFNLRTAGDENETGGNLGAHDGRTEHYRITGDEGLDMSHPWRLRLRIEEGTIHCEAATPTGPWRTYRLIQSSKPFADPLKVRVGKLDNAGGGTDYATPGELGRLTIQKFAAYGPLMPKALETQNARARALRKLRVSVHYNLYDGIPLLSKWITVHNATDQKITVDRFTSDILAAVPYEDPVEFRGQHIPPPNLHVETEYAFGSFEAVTGNRHIVQWVEDPQWETQVSYLRKTPCLLKVEPTWGPDQDLAPGERFESPRSFTLVHDSTDRQRKALALTRMYRTIAPWVTENPLMMHVISTNVDTVKQAIDQCAEVGFEMVILSFGSGFNVEDESTEYLARWKEVAAYAKSKGVEIGCYSLLSSRRISPDSDNIHHPLTGQPGGQIHGTCPALTSGWGRDYFRKLYKFYEQSGFTLLEHDGSYPGDVDALPRPPLQKSMANSQYAQWRVISDFYKWCRSNGVYLNVPDFYYLAGSNKCGMGYRETNWSLPRDHQVIHTRMNIYDGTWDKTPSMGWMFVPLTQYHGGGAAATIEPLDEHLDHYQRMLQSNLALGVQACYRGPRLYDTPRTRDMVKREVDWFKKHRAILESDMIHGRRADGRDVDWMLHVNPLLAEKGMLVLFNPLDQPVTRVIRVPLYYTGLTDTAQFSGDGTEPQTLKLDRQHHVTLSITIPAKSMAWRLIQ